MTAPPLLLTTKLFFPPARENLVSRPRLLEKVSRGLQSQLLLISAPAGYGKTTLLAEWHAGPGSHVPVAWLSLDDEDNDLTRFLQYLVTALGTLKAGIGDSVLAVLRSPQPPPPQVTLTALINDLTNALAAPFALVLDDYHLINSQPVHKTVTFLLDHLPPQMHLVILTRADPPLPLPSLRARNQLTELRASELRFTPAETGAFLSATMGLKLASESIHALEERTEGWIAGLQLAALSIQGRQDPQGFITALTGSHHYIVDYLVEEVINSQTWSTREFLLKTSIVDRLTASLCNALTNQTDGHSMLDKLDHANLFVFPLDDEQRWYRYHQLFADALRNRLQQARPDWLPELHIRAAEWYERHGFVSEAVHHALAGGDTDRAVRLIERDADSLLRQGELVTVLSWIREVESIVCERPWLCIYRSWALTLSGQLDGVERWLQEAERHIPSIDSTIQTENLLGNIAAIRTYVAVRKGDHIHAAELARQALQHLPESNPGVRSAVTATLGRAYWINGELEAASRAFAEAARSGQAADNLHLASGSACSLADLLCELGRLNDARETYQQALQMATLSDGRRLPLAGRAYTGLSKVFYEWNDLDAVAQFTSESIKLCQQFGSADSLSIAYGMLARLKQAEGDVEQARAAIHQAVQLGREHQLWPVEASWVEALRVRLWLAQNDDLIVPDQALKTVGSWVQKGELDIDDQIAYSRQIEYLMYVRMLLARGEHHLALTLSNRLIRLAESASRVGFLIELLLLQALVFHALKDTRRALFQLERAVSLAQPEGYVRVFLDEGTPMAELLRQARSQGIAHKFVSRLLSEFDLICVPGVVAPANQSVIEPLSEREIEILRLVAEGRSNQQIAEALFLARGTVKKHLNNIFGKLGVQNRTQCVARARELELI